MKLAIRMKKAAIRKQFFSNDRSGPKSASRQHRLALVARRRYCVQEKLLPADIKRYLEASCRSLTVEMQHRPSTLEVIAYSTWLLLRAVVTIIYRILTSKAFGDCLAMCGAMLALASGWFWYLSGKGALEPNPATILVKINNLFNYWAGGLSAASAACFALALLLRRA